MSLLADRPSGGQPKACHDCAYLRTGHDGWFECHRHAPQLSIERACDDTAIKPVSRWPNVSSRDWCGEFAASGSRKSGVSR